VELPHLAELNATFEGMPVRFMSVTSGPGSDAAQQVLTDSGVTYETFFMGGDTTDAFGVSGIPNTVIIDHEGRLMYQHIGFREGDEVGFEAEIELLLSWIPEA
jgi:hypothetical protein